MAIRILAKSLGNQYLVGQSFDGMTRVQKADLDVGRVDTIRALAQWMKFGQWEEVDDDEDLMVEIANLPGFDVDELKKPPFTAAEFSRFLQAGVK